MPASRELPIRVNRSTHAPYVVPQPRLSTTPQPKTSTKSQPKTAATTSALFDDIDLHVDSAILDWAVGDVITKISHAYTQKGGWEGWAQVEIATALHESCTTSRFPSLKDAEKAATTTTLREVEVYQDSHQRADIVVESGPPKQRKFVIIELKCEGSKNDGFVRRWEDDIKKIKGDINSDFKPAKAWALAISISQGVYDEMIKRKPIPDHRFLYPHEGAVEVELGHSDQSMNLKVVLWIFEREVFKQKSRRGKVVKQI